VKNRKNQYVRGVQSFVLALILVPACDGVETHGGASTGPSEASGVFEASGDETTVGSADGIDEIGDDETTVGSADGIDEIGDALISEPAASGARACKKDNDCVDPCDCMQGICKLPDVIPGPPPPTADHCNKAPVRACKFNADCQSGCLCMTGICGDDGIGAVNPSCHLPPPDLYEVDDTWQQWKAYGAPQAHNFHRASDQDWVAVYFGGAGKVRVRTHNLSWGADTKLEVYKYITNGIGPMVGTHDDIGGWEYDPNKKASRLDITVPADSAYLVRILNKTPASYFDTQYDFPMYTLSITYL
jgi:hypothetical protein